jgi:hypothetical protein
MRPHSLVACSLVAAVSACRNAPEPSVTSPGGSWFEEVAAARGLVFTHRSGHRDRFRLPEIMGGGVALFDMDNDGDLDAFLVQSGEVTGSGNTADGHRVFRNRGNGYFDDVTAVSGAVMSGYGMGAAAGDYDNDGDVDLYLTALGGNVLLQNDGSGKFRDVTAAAGVRGSGWSTSATFADYDADGWLDLFVTRYIDWSPGAERDCYSLTGVADYCAPRNYDAPSANMLFRNNRNGTLTDVSNSAGLGAAVGNGLGVVAGDFNNDGRVDFFVANDGTPNHLWLNGSGGRFSDHALMQGVAFDQDGAPKAGMGVHAADVDADGDEDVLVVNLDSEADSYFRNDGRFFVDATAAVGLRTVSRRFTRFGMAMQDFDNDGLLDLYEANGRVGLQAERLSSDAYAEPNLLFRGLPGPRFEEVQPRGGTSEPLVATSRGAAFGDIDNDGGVDIVVVNRDAAVHLLRNVVTARGHWIVFRLVDDHGRDAFGAIVRATIGDRVIQRVVRSGYSYLSANDPRVHLGLGASSAVSNVTVKWLDGREDSYGPFEAGQVVSLRRR